MKLYQRENLIFEKIGEEILIIDHKKGHLITLNRTASFLWKSLIAPISLKNLVSLYLEKFGQDKKEDASKGIKDLNKAGVVRLVWKTK